MEEPKRKIGQRTIIIRNVKRRLKETGTAKEGLKETRTAEERLKET